MCGSVDDKSPIFSVFPQFVLTCAALQMVYCWLLMWRVVFIPCSLCGICCGWRIVTFLFKFFSASDSPDVYIFICHWCYVVYILTVSLHKPWINLFFFFNFLQVFLLFWLSQSTRLNWNSMVSIVTHYGLDNYRVECWWGVRFSAPVQTSPGAHPGSSTVDTRSLPRG